MNTTERQELLWLHRGELRDLRAKLELERDAARDERDQARRERDQARKERDEAKAAASPPPGITDHKETHP